MLKMLKMLDLAKYLSFLKYMPNLNIIQKATIVFILCIYVSEQCKKIPQKYAIIVSEHP